MVALEGEGTALLERLNSAPYVIVIDAALSGRPAGTITRLALGERNVAVGERQQSTHGLGVVEAIELARIFGQLPPFLTLYTVEAEQFALGAGLSPQVEAVVQAVADQVCAEARQFQEEIG